MSEADTFKDKGNKAFAAKDYDTANEWFSKAIEADPSNHVLFSNRSACYAAKKNWGVALEDAEQCIKLNPNWGKGYARKGAALHGSHRWEEAIEAYNAGIAVEDTPILRKGLKEVEEAKNQDANPDTGNLGMGKFFSDPALMSKLSANPKTAKHLADPSFMQKLQMLQQNPRMADSALQLDPRMIDVLGVAMGIDLQAFTRDEGSSDLPPGVTSPMSPPAASSSSPPPRSTPAPPKPQQEDVTMAEPEDDEEARAKKSALAEKARGAEAYKKRDFTVAVEAFQKAWDLWPKDVTFLTNLAAAQFEQGEYDQAIATCETAVEEGRSIRADYKLIAKALGRIGSSYLKKDDLPSSIKYFQKSLTEHRTPDILAKLQSVEKLQSDREKAAYLDPAKAAEAREEGNTVFKAGDFASAVKLYTESVKRDPGDARGYNNRAAAYMKLLALPEALKDANEAIKVDGKFVKAYIRKANIQFTMKELTSALETLQRATDIDEEHKHGNEIRQLENKCQQALFTQRSGESQEETLARAMKDPEVASIMNDPVMQQILQQAQQDPGALQEHMKSPMIKQKIQKLINAGVIRTR